MKKADLSLKKQPLQDRSRFMVSAVKEAAAHVLKRQGLAGFTTNAVAERAGVSIGSLYQYFGSKEVLIAEIKREHFAQLRQLFEQAYASLQTGKLEELVDAFVDASVKGHLIDPDLHRVLSSQETNVNLKESDRSDESITAKIEKALLKYHNQLRPGIDIPFASQLLYTVVEKTIHDVVLNNTDTDEQTKNIREIKLMILAYLKGCSH